MDNRKKLVMLPLFLVLFIDGMGLGILFPILNVIILDPQHSILPLTYSIDARNMFYGFTIGIFMLFWFFGAAILGDASDIIGRKKALLVCLIGSGVGYLLSAIAIIMKSVWLLIAGRIIDGFTAGSQPIAQAAVVDISSSGEKSRNLAMIILSISLGFIFGPVFGGFLSSSHLISWFGASTPMYFAALISFLNATILAFTFKETVVKRLDVKLRFFRAVDLFVSAFKHPSVRFLSIIFLLFEIGWSGYVSFIGLFLLQHYHYSATYVGVFLALLGLGFVIGNACVVGFCAKRYTLKQCIIGGNLFAGIGVCITAYSNYAPIAWVITVLLAISAAVAYTMILNLFSNQVGKTHQGWVMGVTSSIMALAFALTDFGLGFLADFGAAIPLWFGGITMIMSGVVLYFSHQFKGQTGEQ